MTAAGGRPNGAPPPPRPGTSGSISSLHLSARSFDFVHYVIESLNQTVTTFDFVHRHFKCL